MFSLTSKIERNDVICFYVMNRKLHCKILDIFMKNITRVGSTVFAIIISLFSLTFNRHLGFVLIINLISSQAIIHLLKRVVNRPRPYRTLERVNVINPPKCKYSLPSGHSGSALSIALVLSYIFPALRLVFISIAACVGISRVYLGCHYPTDVLVGYTISYAVYKIMSYILFI